MAHSLMYLKTPLSALDALSNAILTYQIIDPLTFEQYLRAIAYDLWKKSPNYELDFSNTNSYYTKSWVLFTHSADQLLIHNTDFVKHV